MAYHQLRELKYRLQNSEDFKDAQKHAFESTDSEKTSPAVPDSFPCVVHFVDICTPSGTKLVAYFTYLRDFE